ncbi:MAG: DUF4446 family protein [Thermoleophilia bacterium]|nr:DUF4446 family protein [Thermoleophilia bacterium]
MQAFEILSIVAIALAVLAGCGLVLTYWRLLQYQRKQRVILGSRGNTDIVEHVASLDEKIANMRVAVEDLALAARDHDVRIDKCLSRVGVVRFDALDEMGGRQSTAMAFLNSAGDGVIMTTVVSRDFARTYVKIVKDGEPDIPLAPEEIEAINQARGNAPFVIRPRPSKSLDLSRTEAEDEEPFFPEGTPIALGIPGTRKDEEREVARENRWRRRRGLPDVEETVVPSARGWEQPTTPSPVSMAERFIHERRKAVTQVKRASEEPNIKEQNSKLDTEEGTS